MLQKIDATLVLVVVAVFAAAHRTTTPPLFLLPYSPSPLQTMPGLFIAGKKHCQIFANNLLTTRFTRRMRNFRVRFRLDSFVVNATATAAVTPTAAPTATSAAATVNSSAPYPSRQAQPPARQQSVVAAAVDS